MEYRGRKEYVENNRYKKKNRIIIFGRERVNAEKKNDLI